MKTHEQLLAYRKAWYAKNKERHKSYTRPELRALGLIKLKTWISTLSDEALKEIKRKNWANYVAKNGDALKARRKKLYDPVKARIRRQKYRAADLERVRALNRASQKRNQAHRTHLQRLREMRKKAVTVGDLTELAKVYERARWWRQWFTVQVDHILPLSRGGLHESKNLQIIYDFENWKKHNKPDYTPRVVFT